MAVVLIIEDNPEIRENTAEILELAGYQVLLAADGKEGVHIAQTRQPDLILCDLTMPVLDGYGVLHLLNNKESYHHIPFIFLTARSERSDIRKGMDLGADDYITKPFSPSELLSAISCRLKKSAHLKQLPADGMKGMETLLHVISPTETIDTLKAGRNAVKYKNKQTVYSEGNHPNCLYYIKKGKVKTFKQNDDGKELITGLYNEGEFLGYISLLENGLYSESAETMEITELAIIPRKDFDDLISANNQVMQQFIRLLANNVAEKEVQLLGIAYNSLRKKTAEALLAVYHKYNPSGDESFGIDISRGNLAAVAGVAKESFIRTLGEFREEKLIDIREGAIYLLAIKKLTQLLN
jgi:DNA-binding response OmpR family regulator